MSIHLPAQLQKDETTDLLSEGIVLFIGDKKRKNLKIKNLQQK